MAKPSPSFSGAPELVALGIAVRRLRQERGFSQEAFANEIGLDRSYVGGIVQGEHNLALMNLTRLATALRTKPLRINVFSRVIGLQKPSIIERH